jgi:hypothetical protein
MLVPGQPQDGDGQVRRLAVMWGPNQLGQIGRGACAVSCTDVALTGGHLLHGTDRCWPLVTLAHGTCMARPLRAGRSILNLLESVLVRM